MVSTTDTATTSIGADVVWRRLIERLPLVCLRLTFTTASPSWYLPGYIGGIVRGAFGAALLARACQTNQHRCPPCESPTGCAYAKLFAMSGSFSDNPTQSEEKDQPHPLVLNAKVSDDDRTLTIRLNLFGEEACHLQNAAVAAAIDCAKVGLGHLLVSGELASIEVLDATGVRWQRVPDKGDKQPSQALLLLHSESPTLRIRLRSPLRLYSLKRIVLPEELTADLFIRALMRRVSMLVRLHGSPGPMPAFHPWTQRAANLRLVEQQLEWGKKERFSRRQESRVSISGIVGEFTLAGEDVTNFWPLLKLGEITHVGKGTIHGLGQFDVD